MKLLIHDLSDGEIKSFGDFEDWETVSDDGTIEPCVGCFCCWHKTPGQCVVRDGYENMGVLIHRAEEVCVISRFTYGGFSGFVKNVFDRSLGYVLPQLMLVGTETHHKRRYEEDKAFSFIFYGQGLGEEEKKSAERYVKAVCANIRGHVKELSFVEREEASWETEGRGAAWGAASGSSCAPEAAESGASDKAAQKTACDPGAVPAEKVLLINGSMRSVSGNSAKLAKQLSSMLGKDSGTAALRDYRKAPEELVRMAEAASDLVFCMPLYVDGLPSQMIRFLERMQRDCRGSSKRVYIVANMGLYEPEQLMNLFGAVRKWCELCGFEYCGALGVSAGELIGFFMDRAKFGTWPGRRAAEGMRRLAEAIDSGGDAGEILTRPWAFPRRLYLAVVNVNWNNLARKNGIRPRDLYRRL